MNAARRTTLLHSRLSDDEMPRMFLVREELRDGVWTPLAYGLAAGVYTKDGTPGFFRPFEEGERTHGCPLCFINLTVLWREADGMADSDMAAIGGRW